MHPMERAPEEKKVWTWTDLLALPEPGVEEPYRRYEVLDGELVVTPSSSLRHQRITRNLMLAFAPEALRRGLGEFFTAPLDVIFSEVNVCEPDILFVRTERAEILQDWVRGAPDLAVEILSRSNRRNDEIRKRAIYERFGVAEYWIVDPEAEAVKVYRLGDDGTYGRPTLLDRADDALESPLLSGISVPLAAVFA